MYFLGKFNLNKDSFVKLNVDDDHRLVSLAIWNLSNDSEKKSRLKPSNQLKSFRYSDNQ